MEQRESVLKKQIMDLRKQITEERNQAAVLLSKMKMETEDFQRNQALSVQKQQNFEAKKIELDKRIAELEIRVKEVEARKSKIEGEVEVLTNEYNALIDQHHTLEASQLKRIAELEPQHVSDTSNFKENSIKLEHIKRHTSEQSKRVNQFIESTKVMIAQTIEAKNDTVILTENFHELLVQLKSIEVLDEKTKATLIKQIERMQVSESAHNEFVAQRQQYADRIEAQLEDNCNVNTQLASRYRRLKYGIYGVKLDIMRNLDTKLEQMYNLKDKRQLKTLQNRMHAALRDFFIFKIKHSETKYDKLQVKKEDVADQIESLEELIQNSVHHVSRFLNNQIDFSEVRKMAMEKVRNEEQMEKEKRNTENQKIAIELAFTSGKKKAAKPLPPIGFSLVNAV